MNYSIVKTCKVCKKVKSTQDYYKMVGGRNGLRPICKPCYADYQRQQRKKPRAVQRRKSYLYKHNRDLRTRYAVAVKINTKYSSLILTFDQYCELMTKNCYYCEGTLPEAGVGLDRINNDKGYEINNVLPCCTSCNKTRGDRYTVDETKHMIMSLKLYRKSHYELRNG